MTTSKPSFALSFWKAHFTGNSVSETSWQQMQDLEIGTLTGEFEI